MHLITPPLPHISRAILPLKEALPILQPLLIRAPIQTPVSPPFFALPVESVLFPVAFVAGAVQIYIFTFPISLIRGPISDVVVTIGQNKSAFSAGLIILPLTFIARAIRPQLHAVAFAVVVCGVPEARVQAG